MRKIFFFHFIRSKDEKEGEPDTECNKSADPGYFKVLMKKYIINRHTLKNASASLDTILESTGKGRENFHTNIKTVEPGNNLQRIYNMFHTFNIKQKNF